MAKQDSSKTVFLALSVNFFIGLIKSFVAFITGSSAMFSEAVHHLLTLLINFYCGLVLSKLKKAILNFILLEEDEKSIFGL
ncbi:MAG: hypothetical protein O3B30_02840 [Actinomycetota bacterium]|nr:hypothetical protein [Actinomycetota bacterium]